MEYKPEFEMLADVYKMFVVNGKILRYSEFNKIFTMFTSKHNEVSLEMLVDILTYMINKNENHNIYTGYIDELVRISGYTIPQEEDLSIKVLNTLSNISHLGEANLLAINHALMDIVIAHPDLSKQVLSTSISCSNFMDDKIYTYRLCMRHLPLEETITMYPKIEQDLRVAHRGRFASGWEFGYALENFDKEKLADSMIFSAQQRVMNVLVSMSAQENGISKEDAATFRKPDMPEAVENYMRNNKAWLIPASFKGAAIFKEYFPAYIKTIQNHNQKHPEDKLSVHDAVYWLPEPMSKEANFRFAQFIQKNIIYQTIDESGKHKMVHRPLNELRIIAQNWKTLEKKIQSQSENSDIIKLKYNDVLSICMSVKYEDQRNDAFAVEAANPKHAVPEAQYHNYEDIYLAGLKVPEPFDSKKEFKEDKYTGRFLPRDDVRTGFFGDYTDCCQHFGGVGHSCAVSTVKHPFSQLFVIENSQGEIIAGSWTWENTEGKYREVCFDNIEIKGDFTKEKVDECQKSRDVSIKKMDSCIDSAETTKLADLWKNYSQTLKRYENRNKDDIETKKSKEYLQKVIHLIDNELQAKEEVYESLKEAWKNHKKKQQHYETTKEVNEAITSLYNQAADYLIKEENCRRVTIGVGYQDADVSGYSATEPVELPKLYCNDGTNSYSDAHSQVLLAENPDAEPLDKSQETQRYIRDVCFLDMEAMDRVSDAVFPDGDKQLQAPDNMAGFVIEDREKGVVGYCLYDKEEKSIYDMAVLPEYRTDKNASSKKLFAEMMRTINKEGGQWSAEMREETSFRYLKAMAERGLVKFEEHGIDHVMSDGSKVIAVTFEPIRRNVLQATNKLKQHIETSKETSAPVQSTTVTNGKISRNPTVYE